MNRSWPIIVAALLVGVACGDDVQPKGIDIEANNTNVSTSNATTNANPNAVANNVASNATTPNANPNATANNSDVNGVCPPEARPVYVVEAAEEGSFAQGKLVRWNALERTFTEIGELDCPTFSGDLPFSMSVDRQGVAWVLYQSGDIFNVSTTDGSCTATGFQSGQLGFEVFGMGFVLNSPDLPAESLFIAGGRPSDIGLGTARLGVIRIPSLEVVELSTIGGWPEMSGTAAAELWAFFPQGDPPRVALVEPTSGEETTSYPINSIDGEPNAWAFAHWGGNFYLFYKSQTDPSTRVFELNGETGAVEEVVSDSGRYIVGAGVSTCAPLIIN